MMTNNKIKSSMNGRDETRGDESRRLQDLQRIFRRDNEPFLVQENKRNERDDLADRKNSKRLSGDDKHEIRQFMYQFYIVLLKQDKYIRQLTRQFSRPQRFFNKRELMELNRINNKSKNVVDNIFQTFRWLMNTDNQDEVVRATDKASNKCGSSHRSREFGSSDNPIEESAIGNDWNAEARVRGIGNESATREDARDRSRKYKDRLKSEDLRGMTATPEVSLAYATPGPSGLRLPCVKSERLTDASKRRDNRTYDDSRVSSVPSTSRLVEGGTSIKRRADASPSRKSSPPKRHFAIEKIAVSSSVDSTSRDASVAEGNVTARSNDLSTPSLDLADTILNATAVPAEPSARDRVTRPLIGETPSLPRSDDAAWCVVPHYFNFIISMGAEMTYATIDNPMFCVLEYTVDERALLHTDLDGTVRVSRMSKIERKLRDLKVPAFDMSIYAKRGKSLGRYVLPIASSLSDVDQYRVINALSLFYEIKRFKSHTDEGDEYMRRALLVSDVLVNYGGRLFLISRKMTATFGICGYEPLDRGHMAYRLCARDDRDNLVQCGFVLRTDDHPLHVPPNASHTEPCTYDHVQRLVRVSFRDFDGEQLIDAKLCVQFSPSSHDAISRLNEIHPMANAYENNRKYIGAKK